MRFGLGAMPGILAGLGLFFASGTLAGLFIQWLLQGTDGGWRKFVIASAALATPCAVLLSLAGGLLGPLGVLAYALAPFLVLSGLPALLRWLWLRWRQPS